MALGVLLPLLLAFSASTSADTLSGPCANTTYSNSPRVDVGYAVYEGAYSGTYGLNIWKGVQYAAAPVGKLRWQAPQAPPSSRCRGRVISAVNQPPICPQSGGFGLPAAYGFNSGPGNEDCLYLNVYAPPGAKNLPVFVWIHGGGYSLFGANYDPSDLMNTNDNAFITVEIQYRLGAFGYLASPDVKKHGKLNAGLLDQRFALQWVQKYISKFGGDPTRVTLGGESSGAGSGMYQALAYGGQDSHLFNNIILASPYVPGIHKPDDDVPTENYEAFAELAGCGDDVVALNKYGSVFDCLVAANTTVLQTVSGLVSTTRGYWGSFAWLPVLDGDFIRDRPSSQLLNNQVSGKRLLVGTNANEGVPLTNPKIRTKSQFDDFIAATFPLLSNDDVTTLNRIYDTADAQPGNNGPRFDTLGVSGPNANNQSSMATGIQQTAFNVAAESLFHCPAQWLAEAFGTMSRQAWKYQYSVQPSYHGADLSAYWSVGATTPSADFRSAFQKIWGNFITRNTPVISVADASAGEKNATIPKDSGSPGQISWPQYSVQTPIHMNLNTTGGDVSLVTVTDDLSFYVRTGAGIVNTFSLANALTWEGGRGARCGVWRSVGPRVPN